MAKFWRYLRPINFNMRDYQVFNMAADDALTSRRLLEIEYGEFPMKGLEIAEANERPVSLRSNLADKSMGLLGRAFSTFFTLGYVHGKKTPVRTQEGAETDKFDRAIYLNSAAYSPLGQYYMLSHVHNYVAGTALAVAAGLVPAAKVAVAAVKNIVARPLLAAIMVSSARLMPFVQMLTLPFRPAMDTIGHEHVHVLQVHDENGTGFDPLHSRLTKGLKDAFPEPLKAVSAVNSVLSLGVLPYLANDGEIQARMHTTLARGYRKDWHRMPATKHELWGALISGGLKAPASVRKELAESKEEGVKDFLKPGLSAAFKRSSQKLTHPDVTELNAVYSSLLRKESKEKFWNDVLPFLYGHLVELYGDPQGRRRMNMPGPVRRPQPGPDSAGGT